MSLVLYEGHIHQGNRCIDFKKIFESYLLAFAIASSCFLVCFAGA